MSGMTEKEILSRVNRLTEQHRELNKLVDEQNKKQTMSDTDLKVLKTKRCKMKYRLFLYEAKLMELVLKKNRKEPKNQPSEVVESEKKSPQASVDSLERVYDSDFSVGKDGTTREDFNTIPKSKLKQAMVA